MISIFDCYTSSELTQVVRLELEMFALKLWSLIYVSLFVFEATDIIIYSIRLNNWLFDLIFFRKLCLYFREHKSNCFLAQSLQFLCFVPFTFHFICISVSTEQLAQIDSLNCGYNTKLISSASILHRIIYFTNLCLISNYYVTSYLSMYFLSFLVNFTPFKIDFSTIVIEIFGNP